MFPLRLVTVYFLLVAGAAFALFGGFVAIIALGAGGDAGVCVGGVGGVGFLTGAGMIALGVLVLRHRAPADTAESPEDERAGRYRADTPERREVDGKSHEVLYKRARTGRGGRPSSLSVRVPAAIPSRLQLNRENWFDRLSKRVGISREHQTGDKAFDAAVYVRGPSDRYAELLLADDQRRAAVLALLDAGFTEIRLDRTHAVAIWRGFRPSTDDHDDLSHTAADLLRQLSATPPPADPVLSGQGDGLKVRQVVLWAVAIGFAITAPLLYLYHPVHLRDLLWRAAVAYAVLMPAFAWAAAFLLRGRNTSHDLWLRLMSVSLLLIGLGCVGTVAGVNAWADQTPPETHTLTVSNKHVTEKVGKSNRYWVYAPRWDGQGEYAVEVSSSQYQQLTPGKSTLSVTTGGGGLGVPWVRSRLIDP